MRNHLAGDSQKMSLEPPTSLRMSMNWSIQAVDALSAPAIHTGYDECQVPAPSTRRPVFWMGFGAAVAVVSGLLVTALKDKPSTADSSRDAAQSSVSGPSSAAAEVPEGGNGMESKELEADTTVGPTGEHTEMSTSGAAHLVQPSVALQAVVMRSASEETRLSRRDGDSRAPTQRSVREVRQRQIHKTEHDSKSPRVTTELKPVSRPVTGTTAPAVPMERRRTPGSDPVPPLRSPPLKSDNTKASAIGCWAKAHGRLDQQRFRTRVMRR